MPEQSSRYRRQTGRAVARPRVIAICAASAALAIGAVAATGCGSDDEDVSDAVKSLQEGISTAQEQAQSVKSEAEEQAKSVQEQSGDYGY